MNFKLLPIALAVTGVFALTQRPVFAAEADAERSYGDEGYDVIALEPEAPAALARAAEPRGLTIEEVVVTAQKKQEAVSTVPISISAFSGEDLAALGVTDVRDLRNVVPGFNASDSGYNTPVYTLRGVGFNDSTYSATSTVGLYVDEVNLPYSIMSKGATIDLERVEVLKGPQGILYGRNTTGGLINYIAKKPTDTFEAGLSATYGRFNATDLEGYVSGPLTETIKGRLAVRDIRSQDGWQESVTRPGDTLGRQDKQSFRGALEWTASDTLDVRLAAEGWRDRSEPQAPQAIGLKVQQPIVPNTPELVQRLLGVLPPALTSLPVIQSLLAGNLVLAPQVTEYPFLTPQTDDPQLADWSPDVDWRLNDQFISASLRADWSFAEAYKLTGLLSYLDMESKDSELPQTGLNSLNAERRLNAYIRTTAAEIRLSRDAGDDYSWLIGFNGSYDDGYEHAKTYQQTISAAFPVLGTGLSDSVAMFGDQDATQLAVYANGDYRLSETLRASGGMRYTYESVATSAATT